MNLRLALCLPILAAGVVACSASPTASGTDVPAAAPSVNDAASASAFRNDAATLLARRIGAEGGAEGVVRALHAQRESVSLETLSARLPVLGADVAALRAKAARDGKSEPEVWLYEPADSAFDAKELLVAFAPAGNERSWTDVRAYDLAGNERHLDPHVRPTVPVLVIESKGRVALRDGVRAANEALARAGLQPRAPASSALTIASATGGTWTLRLDSISLQNDEEPWISGSAEVYAIVSGVVGDNQPVLRIVDLPYLDTDGKTYYPNQIIANWADFSYQALNVQLFEQDDNTDYKTLVTALVAAVGAAGSLAGQAEVTAIATIAGRILEAMPNSWFTNDDDYVDSVYTVEKTVAYTGRIGAAGNACVTLTPFFLAAN